MILPASVIAAAMRNGIEQLLFPERLWSRFESHADALHQLPDHEFKNLMREYAAQVDALIECLLAEDTEADILETLAALDPTTAVCYRERLEAAERTLRSLPPGQQIELPDTWTEALRLLLTRGWDKLFS